MASPSTNALSQASADLVPFVPRLTLEWLRDDPRHPGASSREPSHSLTSLASPRCRSASRASEEPGAEEVTEVMNATFAALLAVAYAQGGGLLKFGGDALLLLYDGEEHARRAARAAFEMRRTLRAIGRPRDVSRGDTAQDARGAPLRPLSVLPRRRLASRTADRRPRGDANGRDGSHIGGRRDPREHRDGERPRRRYARREEGQWASAPLRPRGTRLGSPSPAIEGIPLEVAVPAPLRAQLLEIGPLEGEHRHASIAFIRFSGTDEIIETEGPDAAADALDALVRAVQAAADEHKVTFLESDIDRDGGRIILVSGAPQTFGDDEERMLRTVRAVVDAGLPLPVHIGVSEGRVFTGQVGASFRRTYTVLGDTAALAARLMARAGEDEIWVSAGTLTRGGASFEATELEPLSLKGKAEPVQAFVLGELLAAATERTEPRPPQEKLPFVDRERERAVLAASVAPVRMGFGTLVELVGEPGIGKSRLAEELRENCGDMRQIELRCAQYEASTPYYPFRPFLRSLLDVELNGGGKHNRAVLGERLSDRRGARALGAVCSPRHSTSRWRPRRRSTHSTRRSGARDCTGSWERSSGSLLDSPTLLVFDDVHWMDDASSELLRYLGTQLPTRPWLACTTRRPGEDGFAAATGTPPLPALRCGSSRCLKMTRRRSRWQPRATVG